VEVLLQIRRVVVFRVPRLLIRTRLMVRHSHMCVMDVNRALLHLGMVASIVLIHGFFGGFNANGCGDTGYTPVYITVFCVHNIPGLEDGWYVSSS